MYWYSGRSVSQGNQSLIGNFGHFQFWDEISQIIIFEIVFSSFITHQDFNKRREEKWMISLGPGQTYFTFH